MGKRRPLRAVGGGQQRLAGLTVPPPPKRKGGGKPAPPNWGTPTHKKGGVYGSEWSP